MQKCLSRFFLLIFFLGAFLALSPLKNYFKAVFNFHSPQLILVLGGDVDREHVGARLAMELGLPLVVSGGSNPEHASWLIESSGINPDSATLDYRAKDTLTNFTSLVDDFLDQGVDHALLITSEDHLSRAMAVGWVVAGSRGIHLTGISVPCVPLCKRESLQKKFFDLSRSWFWVGTGKDIKALAQNRWPKIFNDF